MKIRRSVVLAAVPLLALAACGGDDGKGGSSASGSGKGGTFDVVFVSGLSGPIAPVGTSMQAALEAAVESINADGGINGQDVKLEALDGQGDPTKSVDVLQKRLANGDKPDLVYAGVVSAETLAMLPILAREGIPSVASAFSPQTDDIKAYPLHHGIIPTAVDQILPVKGYAKDHHVKKMVVLATQDASGDASVAGVRKTLSDTDVKVDEVRITPDTLDTASAWEQVKAAHPDAVFVNALGELNSRLFAGRVTAGATDIPLIAGTSTSGTGGGPAALVSSPDALKNVDMTVFAFSVDDGGKPDHVVGDFIDGYRSRVDKPGALIAPASAWDALHMFKYAAEQAHSTEPQAMVDAINKGLHVDPGSFVIYPELTYAKGHILPSVSQELFENIPASSAVGDDGRFVVDAG